MIAVNPDPQDYEAQLIKKEQAFAALLSPFAAPSAEVFRSPVLHFRQRAEFKVWHEGTDIHYAVFDRGRGEPPTLLENFPVASERINSAMPALLDAIRELPVLRRKLFQVEFLSTLSQDLLITLVYHRALDAEWETAARGLEKALQAAIVGRSRKQKIVLSRDFVEESFQVAGREFRYRQLEGCFSQPNGRVCEQMLNWASDSVAGSRGALLELYCGNGNFTLPLSQHFERVLATEISKPLTRAADYNCHMNEVHNIAFARMAAEEMSAAMGRERAFRRLEEIRLEDYDFSTVFVDPPRAGLDEKTTAMVQGFDNILYVSCNPVSLVENLRSLSKTHQISRAALFDQFPYTDHMECGVFLQRKSTA